MARVFIPQPLRNRAGGRIEVQIPGKNLREVIENLEKEIPGAAEYILKDGELKPGLAAIVGEQATRQGLLHKIEDDETEIHFLPAIAGGQSSALGYAVRRPRRLHCVRNVSG